MVLMFRFFSYFSYAINDISNLYYFSLNSLNAFVGSDPGYFKLITRVCKYTDISWFLHTADLSRNLRTFKLLITRSHLFGSSSWRSFSRILKFQVFLFLNINILVKIQGNSLRYVNDAQGSDFFLTPSVPFQFCLILAWIHRRSL